MTEENLIWGLIVSEHESMAFTVGSMVTGRHCSSARQRELPEWQICNKATLLILPEQFYQQTGTYGSYSNYHITPKSGEGTQPWSACLIREAPRTVLTPMVAYLCNPSIWEGGRDGRI